MSYGEESEELIRLGEILDRRPQRLGGLTVRMWLAEKWLRVRTREGRIEALHANAVQKEFERRCGRKNIVLKARQMGLTTWSAAHFFLQTITHPGTLTLEVVHTQEAAEEIFRIVHRFVDWLPEELKEGALKGAKASARQIVFPEIDAQLMVVSAGERNAGRGLTVQNLHCSEMARWPGDAGETLAGIRAALAPGGEEILESTPMGVGGCFYEEWQRAEETGAVRHFFPWWMEKRYVAGAVAEESLSEEEICLRARVGLTLEQVGFRRQLRANFRGLVKQEYAEDAESCFLASGESVFDEEALERLGGVVQDAVEKRWNGLLDVWLPVVKGKEYLVAVDPAGGGSDGDYSVAEVVDVATGWQCAEFAGHVGGMELARKVVELAREYNGAWLVVERNNHGSGVLALIEQVCGYERVYRQNGQAGWLTSAVSKPAVIGRLNALLVEMPLAFKSSKLLAECRSFVRQSNGGMGAQSGCHDDRVMAMAIAQGARAEVLLRA